MKPFVDESRNIGHSRLHGSLGDIGQVWLHLSFRFTNNAFAPQPHVPTLAPDGGAIVWDLTHTLAYKVMQLHIFSNVDLLSSNSKLIVVFHLVDKMLEGEVSMPLLEAAQVITTHSTNQDLAKLQAKLVAESIATFNEGVSQQTVLNISSNVSSTMGVAYHAYIATKFVHECRNLRPSVVGLVNANNVFIVSCTGGNATCATPLQVIMDFGA